MVQLPFEFENVWISLAVYSKIMIPHVFIYKFWIYLVKMARVSRGSSRVVCPSNETSSRPRPNRPPSITNYTPEYDVAPKFSGTESDATPIGRPRDLPEIPYVPDVIVERRFFPMAMRRLERAVTNDSDNSESSEYLPESRICLNNV